MLTPAKKPIILNVMSESGLHLRKVRNVVHFSLQVVVNIRKENDVYYIGSDAFDIHSQGYTEDEAKENIIEAIQLFIESCYERGVLSEALKELGFEPDREHASIGLQQAFSVLQVPEDSGSLMIDVPLPLLVADHVRQTQAH